MLLSMNAELQQEVPVPDAVKNRHVYGWYLAVLLLAGTATAEIVGGDVFGAMVYFFIMGIVIYLVQDGCRNMSMYCLFLLGILMTFQGFFELLGLLTVLNGRSTQQTTVTGSSDQYVYTTKITVHPFFDKSMGATYNLQSALLIVSPIVMIFCSILCYMSYNAYSTSLFADEETGPLGYGSRPSPYGSAYGGYRGNGGGGDPPAPRRPPPAPPRVFEGHGQRLGS
eukprot:gb/GFBE01068516.1/.p1 GENE.gb/GFBE01068516.1/~~gb/GFBE01068516.1/.p1  ORF type:complete len:225 (+),score=50.32 gb/GFBE01068516.1/:1-675(+)